MDISTLNIGAVLVATLAGYGIGAIWYSPFLFAKKWMNSIGMSEDNADMSGIGKIMTLSFFFHLILAFNLGMFLNDPTIGASEGAFYGFLTGFGWVFFVIAINSMYESRPWSYVFITGGHWTITFTIMGLILGAW